jgi:mono/diheme cytochrome c family protein
MKRILCIALIVAVVGVVAVKAVDLLDLTLQVGRMWETPAIKPHERPIPLMTAGVVPFDAEAAAIKTTPPESLVSPVPLSDPAVIAQGQQGYGYYCIQCHGKYHDGNGTVGQSFAPLPGDLRSSKIQQMAEGRIFHEISYGIPGGRQPALAATISVHERWQIIAYVKSLGTRP